MAHEFETGFFTRQAAWHTLGTVLEQEPTTDEAFIHSGLDWQVDKLPMFYRVGGFKRAFAAEQFALVRNTDQSQLGICKFDYQTYQNHDAFEWCRPLVESGFWTWEAAGSLRSGQICWALLKQDQAEAVKGDTLKRYLLHTWSHTGHTSNLVQPTSIRVVCMNTLLASLATGNIERVIHTTGMALKMEQIRDMHTQFAEAFMRQQEDFAAMAATEMSEKELTAYVDALFPVSEEKTRHEVKVNTAVKSLVVAGQASGSKELGITNTAYGAFNGVSEANEHLLGGNRIQDRGMNILFGAGNRMNSGAYRLALNWKTVRGDGKSVGKMVKAASALLAAA